MRDKMLDGDLLPAVRRRWARHQIAHSAGQMPMNEIIFPTARDINAADPSEAIRSADIQDVVARHFRIIEQKDLGGALLHFLFEGIAGNFINDKPETSSWLDLLFAIEDTLMASGELGSDFVYLVASRSAS